MSSFMVLFLSFFAGAFLLLAGIIVILFPSVFYSLSRTLRFFRARRRREFNFVIDADQAENCLEEVEVVYRFDDETPSADDNQNDAA